MTGMNRCEFESSNNWRITPAKTPRVIANSTGLLARGSVTVMFAGDEVSRSSAVWKSCFKSGKDCLHFSSLAQTSSKRSSERWWYRDRSRIDGSQRNGANILGEAAQIDERHPAAIRPAVKIDRFVSQPFPHFIQIFHSCWRGVHPQIRLLFELRAASADALPRRIFADDNLHKLLQIRRVASQRIRSARAPLINEHNVAVLADFRKTVEKHLCSGLTGAA